MNQATPIPENKQSNTPALVLSAVVHLLLLAALFFGVQWKSKAPASVEVEVWRAAPAPKSATKSTPAPKPDPKPEPKPEPKVETPPPKPDIAIKENKKEQKNPEPKKPEPKKPEPKREEPDWKKELAKEQKQLDQQKIIQNQRARAAAEANQLSQLKAEQALAARAFGQDNYASKVRVKIRGLIALPSGIKGNPKAIFEVTQLPSGDIINVMMRKSSGNSLLDTAIERAINKSSPLPTPDNPADFERVLNITYRPFDD